MIQNKKTFASILFVLISFVCSAQGPPCPGCPPSGPQGLQLPIDNGVITLLIVGAIFGVYKIYRLRKKAI